MAQYGSTGSTSQINEDVAINLRSIKTNWQQLEKLRKLIGTDRDTPALRSQITTLQLQTNEKIKSAEADINRIRAGLKRDDKMERHRLSRCAGDFKDILEKYSQCRTAIGAQKKQNPLEESTFEESDEQAATKPAEQTQLAVDTGHLEIAVLKHREGKIRQLETDMLDLNSIMRDMAAMTVEQGEQILEIHNNVEESVHHIAEANRELQKATGSTNQRRKWLLLLIIIVAVLVVILLLYCLL